MPLYEFRCPSGHAFERLAERGADGVPCWCGVAAERRLSTFASYRAAEPGVPFAHYHEAAQEAQHAHDRTDDPAQRAATRPDIWRPALVRSRNKIREDALGFTDQRTWTDPRPKVSEREVREEVAG